MNDAKNQSNKQHQKNQRQEARQEQGQKKQSRNPNLHHEDRKYEEHEHPEMRLTR